MSEWLDLMLDEIERKKQEDRAAKDENDRRRAEGPATNSAKRPARKKRQSK